MKKLITLVCCMLAAGTLFLACSKDNDAPARPNYQDLLTKEDVSVSPKTLQIVGNTIPASFTVSIPARFLPRKALLTLTPALVCGDKTYKGTAKTWQGDRVTGGNDVIPYDEPSRLQLFTEFAYEKTMATYILYLEVHVIENTRPTSFRIRTSEGQFERQ